MAGIPQRRTYVADPAMAKIDQSREDLAQILRFCPFIRGKLVEDVLVVTRTLVTHNLGSVMRGYFPTMSIGAGGEYPLYDGPGPDPKNQVYFVAGTAPFEGDLWFF